MIEDSATKIVDAIVENIVNEAKIDSSGISWDTISKSIRPGQFERRASYNLESGNLGIVIFLLAYYEKKQDERLIEIIDLALYKAFNFFKKHEDLVGFYNGRGGAIYVQLTAYRILGDETYLYRAVEMSQLNYEKVTITNLAFGLSGLLTGFLHLFAVTKDLQLLEAIKHLVSRILTKTKVTREGVYWDEIPLSMRPINGFLYGNSGIVFALRQASGLFQDNSVFDNVVKEALAFEDSTFCQKNDNWPDFLNEDYFFSNFKNHRKTISKKPVEKNFFKPAISFSWGFGSFGMLLVRSKSITQNHNYLRSLEKSVAFLRAQQIKTNADFGLYRGLGGAVISLLHLNYTVNVDEIISGIVAQKKKYKELLSSFVTNRKYTDLSLFNGEAGIGYLLLKSKNIRDGEPSVLFPFLKADLKDDSKIVYLESEINSLIVRSNCPIDVNPTPQGIKQKITFYDKIQHLFETIKKQGDLSSSNNLKIELFNLMQEQINFHYLLRKDRYNLKNFKESTKPRYVSISKNCKFVENSEGGVLLTRSPGKINVTNLNPFGNALLSACAKKKEVRMADVHKNIIEITDVKSKQDINHVKQKVQHMIANFIKQGVLEYR